MHEMIMGIGLKTYNLLAGINTDTLLDALSITITGWFGIFIVTGVIILVVYLLSRLDRSEQN